MIMNNLFPNYILHPLPHFTSENTFLFLFIKKKYIYIYFKRHHAQFQGTLLALLFSSRIDVYIYLFLPCDHEEDCVLDFMEMSTHLEEMLHGI